VAIQEYRVLINSEGAGEDEIREAKSRIEALQKSISTRGVQKK